MRNQAVLVLIPAAALVATLAAPASAGTLKVGKGKQFEKIGDAVAMAAEGDKIVVSKGVYTENVTFQDLDGITLIGRRAVWDGGPRSGDPCLSGEGNDWTIQGFTFRNGSSAVNVDGNGWTIRKCNFRSSGHDSIRMEGDMVVVEKSRFRGAYESAVRIMGDDATVKRNHLRQIGGADDKSAIFVEGNGTLIERNNVKGTGYNAITVHRSQKGVPKAGDNAKVLNNRIDNSRQHGVAVGAFEDDPFDDVLVAGNRITAIDGDAIRMDGDDCTIERNVLRLGSEQAIELIGDRVMIRFNSIIDFVEGDVVRVKGDEVEISDNTIRNHDDDAISYNGDDCRILRNLIVDGLDNDGIWVRNEDNPDEKAQGGRIEDNVLVDCQADGIDASLDNGMILRNTVRSCGVDCDDHGIELWGDGTTVADNLVDDAAGTGIDIEGNGNNINDNLVRNCGRDGYTVRDDDTTVMRCTALNCGGEGLDNKGLRTTVMGCLLKGNRRDVATEEPFANDATFDTDNTFFSGGRDTKPLIGCD